MTPPEHIFRQYDILGIVGQDLDAGIAEDVGKVAVDAGNGVGALVAGKLMNALRAEVIDVDGVRVLFGDGWALLRASNTPPVIVARGEVEGWLKARGVTLS